MMSSESTFFKGREHAIEDMYFSQNDRDLLKNLVTKMEKHEKALEHAHPVLTNIFNHHGVKLTDALAKDLKKWRAGALHE